MESIKIKSELKTKIEQKPILTLALREALSVLEMPLFEFADWIQKQIEHNPALQFQEETPLFAWQEEISKGFEVLDKLDFSFQASIFPEMPLDEISSVEQIAAPPHTLRGYLLQQARETLSCPTKLQQMEELIDSLDEHGFLSTEYADIDLVRLLQSFDPPGIGAQNLQHCLLLQLERKGGKNLLAYCIIKDHYEDLLQNRQELLCQKLSCTSQQLQRIFHEDLSSLNLNPASLFHRCSLPVQIPDIFVEPSDNGWIIRLNDEYLPKFQVDHSPELRHYAASARWVEKIISRRSEIIIGIVQSVVEAQSDFFHGKTSNLQPLSLRHIAHQLALHESTISRAVKEKYLSCPQGIFPLRYFFPRPSPHCEISHLTAKERLKELIDQESKLKPLSDQKLAVALQSQGIPCARRTITKYRKSLQIPSASQRRQRSLA